MNTWIRNYNKSMKPGSFIIEDRSGLGTKLSFVDHTKTLRVYWVKMDENGFISGIVGSVPPYVRQAISEYFNDRSAFINKLIEAEIKDVPQTMKPQEKPELNSEDHGMEDYENEDLEKAKDKGKESGSAVREVPDKELEQKPTKESKVDEHGPACRKSRELRGSKIRKKRIKEQLNLCNDCGKTFRGNKTICECGSKNTELIGEREYSDMAGSTKSAFKVTFELDGKQQETRVEAFDDNDAKRMVKKMKPGSKNHVAKEIKEDKIKGGLADDKSTGDFDSEQLRAGINIEMEHTDDLEKAEEIAMDHLTEDPEYYTKLKKMEAGKCDEIKTKLTEGIMELVGEIDGLDEEDQRIIRWAVEQGSIPTEFPSDEEMIDVLSLIIGDEDIDMDPEGMWDPDTSLRASYLRFIILPRAMRAHTKFVKSSTKENESKVNEEENSFMTVARGISDKMEAEKLAKEKNGQAVADDEDKEKFMVIVRNK